MTAEDSQLPLWLAFLSISEQAMRDWLTGLHNRRYFEETLADHVEAARRYSRELSLVLFDIDHFKQVNDTGGHETGDEVLRQFAGLLKSTARKADIVCRYGGDEFAVILPETGKQHTERFVERVSLALAKYDWRVTVPCDQTDRGDTVPPAISVTAGSAALPCKNLMTAADTDLLARKKKR
jgi:diguanylate cyclase (GGDEF)-like protein